MKYKVLGIGKAFTDSFGKEKRFLYLVYSSDSIDGHGVVSIKVSLDKLPGELKVGDYVRVNNDVFYDRESKKYIKYVSSVELIGE